MNIETDSLAIQCPQHGRCPKPWIICVHVEDEPPEVARRVDDDRLSGEVLCRQCAARIRNDDHPTGDLRMACEPCVLDRWKLQDAS